MARKTRKRRSTPRRQNRRRLGGPSLVTPEGDPLVLSTAAYRHTGVDEVLQILTGATDLALSDEPEPGGAFHLTWYETGRGKQPLPAPMGRRILASLTLMPETLEIEAMSKQRLQRCRRRLERLLGERIYLLRTETKSMEQVLAERPPGKEREPVVLPPEAMADLEERMLRQWIDESIPALDGMTPREAVQTPEGRQKVLDLLAYIERQQSSRPLPPGMFTPDYNKVKAMLGLE
jgi:hypothetical protein